jgi:hypothetical protein
MSSSWTNQLLVHSGSVLWILMVLTIAWIISQPKLNYFISRTYPEDMCTTDNMNYLNFYQTALAALISGSMSVSL